LPSLSVFSAATRYEPIYLISIGITVKTSIWALLEVFANPLPPRSGHRHVDFAAAVVGAHEPPVPIGNRHLGAVARRLFGRVGFGLVSAITAPHDQADAGRC